MSAAVTSVHREYGNHEWGRASRQIWRRVRGSGQREMSESPHVVSYKWGAGRRMGGRVSVARGCFGGGEMSESPYVVSYKLRAGRRTGWEGVGGAWMWWWREGCQSLLASSPTGWRADGGEMNQGTGWESGCPGMGNRGCQGNLAYWYLSAGWTGTVMPSLGGVVRVERKARMSARSCSLRRRPKGGMGDIFRFS